MVYILNALNVLNAFNTSYLEWSVLQKQNVTPIDLYNMLQRLVDIDNDGHI